MIRGLQLKIESRKAGYGNAEVIPITTILNILKIESRKAGYGNFPLMIFHSQQEN